MLRTLPAGLALGVLLSLSVPVAGQSPDPNPVVSLDPCITSSASPRPAGEPVVFKGGTQNAGNTERQSLAPGDYELVLKGKAREYSNVILALVGPGMPSYDSIWNEDADEGPYVFTTFVYELEGGDYHLRYDLPKGSWTVTITPLPTPAP